MAASATNESFFGYMDDIGKPASGGFPKNPNNHTKRKGRANKELTQKLQASIRRQNLAKLNKKKG